MAEDRKYYLDIEYEIFRPLDDAISLSVDFLVAGHTHLERRLPRKKGGYYFNAGTWARLMKISPAALHTAADFAPIYAALVSGRLADLDAIPGLILQRRSVVSVWTDRDAVHAEIRRVWEYELIWSSLE